MQYYVPIEFKDNQFKLSKEDIHHISDVLRMKSGDQIYVIHDGKRYVCNIDLSGASLKLQISSFDYLKTELPIKVKLIYGLPRIEKFELVLQKAVELGLTDVVPFKSEFSIIKLDEVRAANKIIRWNRIVKEASEQSHRASLLNVTEPINLNEIKANLSELNIIANENLVNNGTKELLKILNNKVKSISILVGPEGGFSKSELNYFEEIGFKSISLGKRILRSETAAIYLMSVISMYFESID